MLVAIPRLAKTIEEGSQTMLDLHAAAIEAVKCRRAGSYLFGEFLAELERAGCSRERIEELLKWAAVAEPHPDADRALRILRCAAKAARRGNNRRVEHLRGIANTLVGPIEVALLVERHRLVFKAYPKPGRDTRGLVDPRVDVVSDAKRIRHGFATV